MRIWLSTLVFLVSLPTYAQVASGSLFRSMRSENPAVISERPAATFGAAYKMDKVEKKQTPTGSITKSESEIDITTASFFYGGKGGGAFTMEVSGELGSGEKTDSVTTSGNQENLVTESDLTLINVSTGFMKNFGLGLIKISNTNKQPTSTTEVDLMVYTVGLKFNLGLDVGFFYQHAPLDNGGTQDIDMSRIGFGFGKSTKNFHFEIAYVMNMEDEREELGGGSGAGQNVAIHSPAKIMGTLEFKIGRLSLGITSNYYMEGFFDFNNLMYYTMVMARNKENRLENTFNFSLGSEKGSSFSAGVTIATVESTESPPTLLSGEKYKTTTDILGFQLSYAYAF
ncbi:MAG: hypothetical protein COW01_15415 [Bdellovibrionales bacterium CG12_big_fil_rev_8_21_14_0_65_38_15]|nr:MAG: hypothetical protein COW79_14580 [Bdellovibrionales bacterium CG22_combo_CG10-13_8_21_14_all_38_13]PIQ52359.1 MAG: hypothetical protein COW01_15415 [Bdellovibrionales bacterium CG12_big_fil_rev_8_21_14_0_65_38_15]PIR30444.1 MAG: hypothetical protein COV38_06745 [Bdellovibrionales bacterium CG11_big_fil_rev_8_21_14_0_20_38_13]